MTSRTNRPPGGITLVGPFLTRRQVARHLGVPYTEVPSWSLLHIAGRLAVEEVYPEFQFAQVGVRRDLALLGVLLTRRMDHAAACDWLFRAHPQLRDLPPIRWLADSGPFEAVLEALPHPDADRLDVPRDDVEKARAAWLSAARDDTERVGLTAPWDDRTAG
jgi:hypothetical protein